MNCKALQRLTSVRCLRLLLAVLSVSLLPSCSTTGGALIPAVKTLPPESCLQLAEPLPQPADGTLAELVRNHLAVAAEYHALAERQRCLVGFERAR